MRHAILLGPLACVVLTLGCQTAPDPSLVRQRIAVTKSWHLGLRSRLEPGDNRDDLPDDLKYQSVMNPAQSASLTFWLRETELEYGMNIGLVNQTSRALKQKYGVALAEDTSAVSGEIRFTMTRSLNGTLEYIDVALYDVGKQLITRVRVWNNTDGTNNRFLDGRNAYFSPNESIADNIARKTADLLRDNVTVTQ